MVFTQAEIKSDKALIVIIKSKPVIYLFIFLLGVATSIIVLISYAKLSSNSSEEWIPIGNQTVFLRGLYDNREKDAQKNEEFQKYLTNISMRTISWGNYKKNIDLVDLTLKAQSGEAINRLALVAFDNCYAPDVRHGVPSVQCHGRDGGTFILAGDETTRSKALHIQDHEYGYAIVKILGLYGGDALVLYAF